MKKSELHAELLKVLSLDTVEELHTSVALLAKACEPKGAVSDGKKLMHYITVHEAVKEPNVNYPAQMLRCHELLVEEFGEDATVTLAEVKTMIADKAEELKTRQDPERIYAFYQARMADAGWIERSKERVEVSA